MTKRNIPNRLPAGRTARPKPVGMPPPPPPATQSLQPRKGSARSTQTAVIPSIVKVPAQTKDDRPGVLDKLKRGVARGASSWKVWVVLALLTCMGSGAFALAVLLRLPGTPNCPAVFWPLAAASVRLECARLAASKQTTKDLLEAITLLESLPPDHPLRQEADRLIELWSADVLQLAEELFHAGKLNEAIADARRIPSKVSAYGLVEERVKRWQATWTKAEEIYRKAEAELRQQNWRGAFLQAVRLLDVDNRFWQTTKYTELNQRITTAREEGDKLVKADRLAEDGGVQNLLQAIKILETINSKSYLYQAARKAITKHGRSMIDLAQEAIDARDLQGALNLLSKIPDSANLQEEIKDYTALAYAQTAALQRSVGSLEEAISQAQRIAPNRPLHKKAQQLITRWQLEIEGVAQLDKARGLAQSGSPADLVAAIAQASQINSSNPRWDEAQQQIRTWTNQIQEAQDRPILDQADVLASRGDVAALQAAIAQASQIGASRSLRQEARKRIQQWTVQVERIQDQPYLDQSRQLASAGNLAAAIDAAAQIRAGRSLYDEAQTEIRAWRGQLQQAATQAQAQQDLQEAVQLANVATVETLVAAIQKADRVPASSGLRSQADNAIGAWSQQLLQLAEARSATDVAAAVAIAQQIPNRTAAYAVAQQRITAWKQLLSPPPLRLDNRR
ncbi:MAG TPA: hypothetical protein V6D18_07115 [Thermosynechococcaceae cyanobacterium]